MRPLRYEPIAGFGMTMVALFGVAALVGEVTRGAFHRSIPWEAKKPLVERYGRWAVELAEALCPHNDVACVEREARRLIEVRRSRR